LVTEPISWNIRANAASTTILTFEGIKDVYTTSAWLEAGERGS
jgi:hypothetical protein